MLELLSPFDAEGGINLAFVMVTAFLIGIVVVWRRYEDMQSRAVPFHWPAPEVRVPPRASCFRVNVTFF